MALRLQTTLNQPNEKSSEIRLWYAVLAQAITDASYLGIRKSYVDCKRQAIEWLQSDSTDFKMVCTYADLEPDYVKRKFDIAFTTNKFNVTDIQSKIMNDRRTPAQIKYEKKNFKLIF